MGTLPLTPNQATLWAKAGDQGDDWLGAAVTVKMIGNQEKVGEE